jgi:DNA processing protein
VSLDDDPADDLAAWLWLVHRTGVGRATLRRLLATLGSPQAVIAAGQNAWQAVLGRRISADLGQAPPDHAGRLAVTRAWLAADARRSVPTLADAGYPETLLQAGDPPLLLYLEGRTDLLAAPSLAVVGSRRPTAQGLDHARHLSTRLSEAGWTIVSGLASGIDGAAHEGGLQGRASTVAVVGTGLDQVYPRSHRALARRIAEQGLLVSEYPLGTPPLAEHFPQRNRIIAGLSRGTLVVEAALRSGSLITARLAAEAGREVFAIPGSILSPQVRGCHALLRDGATLVETADDILAELPPLVGTARPTAMPAIATSNVGPVDQPDADEPEPEDPVLRALGHDPATLDVLMARCGWSAPELGARLLTLELEGRVARLPGGLFQRRGQA